MSVSNYRCGRPYRASLFGHERAIMSINRLVSASVFVSVLLVSPFVMPDMAIKPRVRPKTLKPNQLWISSVPIGLKVYIAPEPDEAGTQVKDGEAQLTDKDALIVPANLKGQTPLLVHNLKPGRYQVAVMPVRFLNRSMRSDSFDPSLELARVVAPGMQALDWSDKVQSGAIKAEGALIYRVEKGLTGKSIVVLALSKEDTPDQTKSHYPNGANYKFDAEAPRMELRGLNVFADEAIEDLFALLRRGGKAVLAKGDISVVAEIDEEGSCVLHKKIRVPTEKK